MTSTDEVIRVEDVSKRYRIDQIGGISEVRRLVGKVVPRLRGTEPPMFWALRNIDLTIREGEVVGIIGRNGAGKSTLLKILARITEPTSGRASTRGRVGALLEVGTGFQAELTGRENVYLNGAILGMTRQEVNQRFDEIIEFSGVERFIDTPLKRYSSGMELRLAFAVAAHLEPEILVVDEVLAVGDAEFQRKCLGRMNDFTEQGRTILFVTHDHGAMARLVSRVVWLDEGRVVADGPTEDVLTEYAVATAPASDDGGEGPTLPRTEALTVESIDVSYAEGAERSVPRRGQTITIDTRFKLERPAPGLDVGFYIKTSHGVWLINEARSDHLGTAPLSGQPGVYTITVLVPGVLPAGDYVFALWIGSYYEELVDQDVLRFTVAPHFDDLDEARSRPRLIQPQLAWDVDEQPIEMH